MNSLSMKPLLFRDWVLNRANLSVVAFGQAGVLWLGDRGSLITRIGCSDDESLCG